MKVFRPEIYYTKDGYGNIFTTNCCAMEARFVLSGHEILVGIPYSFVPGDNFGAERAYLSTLAVLGCSERSNTEWRQESRTTTC